MDTSNVEALERVASPEGLGRFCDLRQAAWREYQFTGGRHSSPDLVVAKNHFTNVYRELDNGTMLARRLLDRDSLNEFMVRDYVHRPGLDGNDLDEIERRQHQVLWTSVAYRLTNRASTWEEYRCLTGSGLYPDMDSESEWLDYLVEEKRAGRKIFTGRHLNVGWPRYVGALQEVRHLEPSWIRGAFGTAEIFTQELRTVRGIGHFFSWQVTADLLMSGHLPPAPDHVHLGPGAKLALRWLVDGRPWRAIFNEAGRRIVGAGNGHMKDKEAHAAILDLRANQHAWLPPSFVPWAGKDLDLVDLEHALCEYARWGVLHARRQMKAGES